MFFSPLFPSQPTAHPGISSKANCVPVAEFKFRVYNEVKGVLTAAHGPQILQCIQLHVTCHLYVWGAWLRLGWLWMPLCSPEGQGHSPEHGGHTRLAAIIRTSRISVRVDAGQASSQCQPGVRQVCQFRSRFPQPPGSRSAQAPTSWWVFNISESVLSWAGMVMPLCL